MGHKCLHFRVLFAISVQKELMERLISQSLLLFAVILSKARYGFGLCTVPWLILPSTVHTFSPFFEIQDSFHSTLPNVALFFAELKLDISTPYLRMKCLNPHLKPVNVFIYFPCLEALGFVFNFDFVFKQWG